MSLFVPSTKLFTNNSVQQNVCRYFYLAGIQYVHTHYDTLKLTRNCSTKEIREAFIKLSKQCHPDRNQSDPKTHARFVKLNEAYSILSRPDDRRAYDESLISTKQYQQPSASYPRAYHDIYRWDAEGKSRSNSHSTEDFYGIRGLKRVSNAIVALLCIAVASIGVILQLAAVRMSLTFSRKQLETKSEETGLILTKVREDAQRHGKELQLELLRECVIKSGVDVPPLDISSTILAADVEVTEDMAQVETFVNTAVLSFDVVDLENLLRV